MLQIASKMYFRPGVALYATVHRAVLYTNRAFVLGYPDYEPIPLPIGQLAPSTGSSPVSAVTVTITDHLEAVGLDGQDEITIATDGRDLIDDLAVVLSFALNATFNRDHDLVHRLVPDQVDERRLSAPSNLLRATFDPGVPVTAGELDDLRQFMDQLLGLRRPQYESAMRAMRRVVRAGERAAQHPTMAYTDIVAALESLAKDEVVPAPRWEQVDELKRTGVDAALGAVPDDIADGVRAAIIAAEHVGLGWRFAQFVVNRVFVGFFRREALGARRPIRRPDLLRAVKHAYQIRSRNVHTLWDLPPEAWLLNDRADTVWIEKLGTVLTLEGLARLARHVIRSYVATAPVGVDDSFDWRAALPGTLSVQLAPQHWIHNNAGFDRNSAARYFDGFIEDLCDTLAGRQDSVTDISAVLAKIETLAPGLTGDAKTIMVAIYVLWHRVLDHVHHRPHANAFLARHASVLQEPSLTAFVTGVLLDTMPAWSAAHFIALAQQRRTIRQTRRSSQPVPAAFDAALQAYAAAALLSNHRSAEAADYVSAALDELPGNEQLIAWEASLQPLTADSAVSGGAGPGGATTLDLRALVLGVATDSTYVRLAGMPEHRTEHSGSDAPDTEAIDDGTDLSERRPPES